MADNDTTKAASVLASLGKASAGQTTPLQASPATNAGAPSAADAGFDKSRRIGLIIFALVFGVFGIWASTAPIDGAAHAPGSVVVGSYRQVVQHLEGGIVRQIYARDGDAVNAGEILLQLDPTQASSNLEIVRSQLNSLLALEARLIAERDNLDDIEFPATLTSREYVSTPEAAEQVNREIAVQRHLFSTRKDALEGSIDVLEQRVGQLQSRLEGMRAQRESKLELATSYNEELEDVRSLLADGFADRNRLREIERNAATLRGDAAELASTISGTEIQIGETRLEILQQRLNFQNEVAERLSETQNMLNDVRERVIGYADILTRTTVVAPVSGIVNGLQVHTVGGVINPGMTIADIVPQNSDLVVEGRVSPNDIDRVTIGQEATIRFSSFGNAVPSIFGRVIHLSADAFIDQNTGATYYNARVEVTPEGMQELGDLVLVPGMPAEVFITTGSRTLMQYMLKPLSNALARSFIED